MRNTFRLHITSPIVGAEAKDTTALIATMYQKWGAKHGIEAPMYCDDNQTVLTFGRLYKDLLEGEVGRHRICRISPFDPLRRRHTTWVNVSLDKPTGVSDFVRSYIFHPFTLAHDYGTGIKEMNVHKVIDGDIDLFILHRMVKFPKVKKEPKISVE
jgi:protein subunit release factor B